MKVLQISHKPPLPVVDGGCIAINTISSGLLKNDIDLKILTASTHKHPFLEESYPEDFKRKTEIEGIFVDTRINIIDAFSALVTADSYNVNRFFSPDFNKRLIELLKEDFDVVHLESLFMTPYIQTIRQFSKAKVLLRSHNLEHLIWERLANSTGNKAKKIYLKHLAVKLKKYEQRTINEVDGIAAISFEDTKRYQDLKIKSPLITVPFGVNLEEYNAQISIPENTINLFHIGAMNWGPNVEGINWLLDEIWPKLSELKINLHLAGREMSESYKALESDQIKIHGEVENAIEFMSKYDIMVVPLLSGSGMRIKIIEGMALGKTVISTSIGAEGINYTDGENIIICDELDDFYKQLKRLKENPSEIQRIGSNARRLVESKYDNNQVIQELISFYNNI